MKIKQLLFGLVLLLNISVQAQQATKKVLFTIDDKPYYTDEFTRVYKKNLDLVKDESQKDLNQYLDLFIGYKLKISKAYKLGLQENSAYQSELKQYRGQLAKNYLTDSKVTSELVTEAYDRLQREVRASHILFLVDENALPADTLKVYNQALEIRKKALNGDDFGQLATAHSQDPSAKENQGDLGYFSAFRMVYPFESAAFNLRKGQISKPVRTRFGYHLIKVDDVRANRGEVTVAHIMIMKAKDEAAESDKAKSTILDIYKKLQQGEGFEALARQFSEDKSSSSKGGVLNRFGSGQLSSQEFEDVAFGLSKEKPISEPFQTQFGWHIVKLVDRHPIKPFKEMEGELENKIARDERSRLIAASMNEKLRKQYPVKTNNKLYTAATKKVTDAIYDNTWTMPEGIPEGTLLNIAEREIAAKDFLNYVQMQQRGGLTVKPLSKQLDVLYQNFVDEQLNRHYDENLEALFPEFAAVMDEYRDGLLLFDLMEKEIWEKAKKDTTGLARFYTNNSGKYRWENRLDVIIASSTNMDVIKKAQKFFKQDKTTDYIKEKLNNKDAVNVMTTQGIYEEGNDALPKGLKYKKGVSDILKDGEHFFVVKVNKLLPAGPKSLEDAKGRVINDYQQYLEENWVKDLQQEFSVTVNREVFEELKKEINN
ncbi:MAG: peptidylprolyl isomerase [Flavobacterium sp.]|nr:peptidylprolyl isomerase [Flavobacterium sp.]